MSKRTETLIRLSIVALLSNALMGLMVPVAISQSLTGAKDTSAEKIR